MEGHSSFGSKQLGPATGKVFPPPPITKIVPGLLSSHICQACLGSLEFCFHSLLPITTVMLNGPTDSLSNMVSHIIAFAVNAFLPPLTENSYSESKI